ncbi:hypothetical protein AERO8C_140261 [Aeromonas veronii]|uniref:Uncharacterized protein n=1 Tax=Aeromonas veronii TaxID=654 RepID=A0A653KWJ1_AERVE|nr:hypothetical protein AERO8C_140261 [Aeromonas veronii]
MGAWHFQSIEPVESIFVTLCVMANLHPPVWAYPLLIRNIL